MVLCNVRWAGGRLVQPRAGAASVPLRTNRRRGEIMLHKTRIARRIRRRPASPRRPRLAGAPARRRPRLPAPPRRRPRLPALPR